MAERERVRAMAEAAVQFMLELAAALNRASGPPQLATFLPAFWMLVPGAVGLIGMAEFVGSDRDAGLDHFVHTFVSIGLGVLVGNALVLRLTSSSSPRRPGA